MNYLRTCHTKHNSHDIEPVHVSGAVKTTHPIPRRLHQLALLPPMNRSQRTTIIGRYASLHLDECHRSITTLRVNPFGDQVDIAMPASKPPIENAATFLHKKLLGDSFASLSEYLSCDEHDSL